MKRSRVKECTRKVHRVPLPRVTDVAFDILDSLAKQDIQPGEDIEVMVLDFEDAFWNIPLAAGEPGSFLAGSVGNSTCFSGPRRGRGMALWQGPGSSPL